MFSMINTILLIFILIRVYKTDKFYIVKNQYTMKLTEVPKNGLSENKDEVKTNENKNKKFNNKH